ncbi:MAG: DUF3667 domain-containing protein [Bacteroidota bacterium]|nr:DUF3667 domain-containing protein [Bacteroidota bacterium]
MNCLHCNSKADGSFCQNCGQKTTTHRFLLKHMITHDFVHGVFHLDKGFLFTIKELFTRPGHSIRDYIQGKRAKHFNCFTLLILIITVGHIVGEYSTVRLADFASSDSKEFVTELETATTTYPKLFVLLTIPIYGLISFLWFRTSKQNYTEHVILNSYKSAGELLIASLFTILTIFYTNLSVLKIVYSWMTFLYISYTMWFYFQYFSKFGYTKTRLFVRSLFASITLTIILASITFFVLEVKKGIE